jgi:hypothetical protein
LGFILALIYQLSLRFSGSLLVYSRALQAKKNAVYLAVLFAIKELRCRRPWFPMDSMNSPHPRSGAAKKAKAEHHCQEARSKNQQPRSELRITER